MSTRAAYFFKDDQDHFMVYKHHDGYPTGAVQWLTVARRLAWKGARFEADEAAASFVTAAKLATELSVAPDGALAFTVPDWAKSYATGDHGGGVRLMAPSSDPKNIFAACKQCCDIEFAYIIESKSGDWHVTAYHARIPYTTPEQVVPAKKHMTKLWAGPLAKMAAWAEADKAKAA